jgi:hypothetical protein
MLVKVKDVVRTAPIVVTAAPINSLRSRSLALPSELVPRACVKYLAAEFNNFTAVQQMNNTPRSVVGRAHTGEHHENTGLLQEDLIRGSHRCRTRHGRRNADGRLGADGRCNLARQSCR